MGANDASTSGGPGRSRRQGAIYALGRHTELGPPKPKRGGKETLCASPGPEWDILVVPGAPRRSAPSARKRGNAHPRPKSAPPTKGGASHAVFRPIDAHADQERPQSAPLRMLSPEEVDEVLTDVDNIAKLAAKLEQLGAQ